MFSQHSEVLGDRGLAYAELLLNNCDYSTGTALPLGEQFKYTTANWIAENIESVHQSLGGCVPV